MKTKSLFRSAILSFCLVGVIVALTAPLPAKAQVVTYKPAPRDFVKMTPLTLFTNTCGSGATPATNTTTAIQWIDVVPGCAFIVGGQVYGSGTGTSNAYLGFAASMDGVTALDTNLCKWQGACLNSNTNGYAIAVTNNVQCRYIGVQAVGSQQTNAVTFQNFSYGWLPLF